MNPIGILINRFVSGLEYYAGWLIGAASTLVAGGGDLRALEQASNIVLPNEIPGVAEISEQFRRGILSEDGAKSLLLRHGYDDTQASNILAIDQVLLGAADLVRLVMRGNISDKDYRQRAFSIGLSAESADLILSLAKQRYSAGDVFEAEHRGLVTDTTSPGSERDLVDQGYDATRIDILRKLAFRVPTIADLFNIAAWKADDPGVVKKFGLDQGMPDSFLREALAAGFTPEVAQRLYNSHWQVPSIFILRELVQSGQFTEADVEAMLATFQIAPAFIPKIAKAFAKPPSTSNITAGLVAGSITASQVPSMLQRLGYAEADIPLISAELVASAAKTAASEATAASKIPPQFRGESESVIIESYTDQLITRDEAVSHLKEILIDPGVAELLLSIADYKIHKAALNEAIALVTDSFLLGDLTVGQAQAALSTLGLTDAQVAKATVKMLGARKKQSALPGVAELKAFLKAGVIKPQEFVDQMSMLGYSWKYIQWYLADLGATPQVIAELTPP